MTLGMENIFFTTVVVLINNNPDATASVIPAILWLLIFENSYSPPIDNRYPKIQENTAVIKPTNKVIGIAILSCSNFLKYDSSSKSIAKAKKPIGR